MFYERKVLCGIKLVWSNGSTDVVGKTEDDNSTDDMKLFTVSLSEGEHIRRLDLCIAGLIEKLKLTSNKGKVFEPLGYGGGPEINVQKYLRIRGINPEQLYLDGIRGNVVRPFGAVAVNRISFKWSFVVDKMELPHSYYQPLPEIKSEKISILDLEKEIEIIEGVEGPRDWPLNRDNEMVVFPHVPFPLAW